MYAKLNNGQIETYPYTIGQLRKDNPNVSFPKNISPETLASFNVVEVQSVSPPTVSDTEVWHESNPVLDNGVWKQSYTVSDATQEEIDFRIASKAAQIRAVRDRALEACDWRVIRAAEAGVTIDEKWATYRQALRDLPNAEGFPNVDVPQPPDTVIVFGNID